MKFKETLFKIEAAISGLAFSTLIIITSINVVYRIFFLKTIPWTEEVSYLCFNWAVFFGACMLYSTQGLIAIDILVDHLPAKARHSIRAGTFLLLFVLCVLLVIWGFDFAIAAWVRPSSFLHIPYFFYDVSVPLASMIMAGYSLDFFIQSVRGKDIESLALEDRA